jgi:hypothetical protein
MEVPQLRDIAATMRKPELQISAPRDKTVGLPFAPKSGPPVTINLHVEIRTGADGKVDAHEIGRIISEHIKRSGRELHEVLAREEARQRRTAF